MNLRFFAAFKVGIMVWAQDCGRGGLRGFRGEQGVGAVICKEIDSGEDGARNGAAVLSDDGHADIQTVTSPSDLGIRQRASAEVEAGCCNSRADVSQRRTNHAPIQFGLTAKAITHGLLSGNPVGQMHLVEEIKLRPDRMPLALPMHGHPAEILRINPDIDIGFSL